MRKKGFDKDKIYFQQDGAAPHTSTMVLEWLNDTFGRRLISLKTEHTWPPHSPDLNILDFFYGVLSKVKYIALPQAHLQNSRQPSGDRLEKLTLQLESQLFRTFAHESVL